jgi:hypothetical protein
MRAVRRGCVLWSHLLLKSWVGTGRRNERMTTEERFWQKVCKDETCWEWQGYCQSFGHGVFHVDRDRHMEYAHRFAWELARGPIPAGMFVLHTCDNPSCVNPEHLFLGTQADNNRDRHAKGRSKNLEPGSSHPKACLEDRQVRQMRRMYLSGWVQRELAEVFGVSRGNVSKIVNGKSYREVVV